MSRKTTRIIQGLFFAAFLSFFVLSYYPNHNKFDGAFFLKLDPLFLLVASIGMRKIAVSLLWSVLVLVLTVIMGRVFCGMICPMGTFLDIVQSLFKKKRKRTSLPKLRNLRFYILTVVLVASLFSVMLIHYFSPLSLFTRISALIFYPASNNLSIAVFDFIRDPLAAIGIEHFEFVEFSPVVITGGVGTLFLLILIVIAEYFVPRFWCRYVCPSGALLSIFSRFAFYRRRVDKSKCNDCQVCARKCPMDAIPEKDGFKTLLYDCTLCGKCIEPCKQNGTVISFGKPEKVVDSLAIDYTKRTFLKFFSLSAVGAVAVNNAAIRSGEKGKLVRPPGAIEEEEFLAGCMRCGECVRACKSNVIQPQQIDEGFSGLWAPKMVFRITGCERECNVCGHVCPSEVIRPLSLEEKTFVKIGTAVVDRERCVAFHDSKLCLICDEICPYDAITMELRDLPSGQNRVPVVNYEKCTGCGLCEWKCPVLGLAAITVYNSGEERKSSGSYITDRKKELREVTEEVEYKAAAEPYPWE